MYIYFFASPQLNFPRIVQIRGTSNTLILILNLYKGEEQICKRVGNQNKNTREKPSFFSFCGCHSISLLSLCFIFVLCIIPNQNEKMLSCFTLRFQSCLSSNIKPVLLEIYSLPYYCITSNNTCITWLLNLLTGIELVFVESILFVTIGC